MAAKPKNIDEYLATVDADKRAALEKLRKTIQSAAPEAEECISYGLAAFRLHGKPLVGFGAATNHCAFFPMDGTTVEGFKDDLKDYETSKGAIRFQPEKPLPVALVRKLVKAKIAANEEKSGSGKKGATLPKKKITLAKGSKEVSSGSLQEQVQSALEWLEKQSTEHDRQNLAKFGISTDKFFGVSMAKLKVLAKQLGRSHELAAALWATGWYEARMLASLVDEPERVTPSQMDSWRRDFDNWGICDTVCFCLFDRSPHACRKVEEWRDLRDEFSKRAAFALLASLALHDKKAGDEPFVEGLDFVEKAATDERNFVKKAVVWALRAIGERNPALHAAALALAQRLIESPDATAKWVGKTALKELTSSATTRRLAAAGRRAKK